MKRFFGGLCMVIGFLVATGAGLCSLVYIFSQSRSFYDVLMTLLTAVFVSGIPILIGVSLFQCGQYIYPFMLSKEDMNTKFWRKSVNLSLGWMSIIVGIGLYGLAFLMLGLNSFSMKFSIIVTMSIPILVGVKLYKLGQFMTQPYKGQKDDTGLSQAGVQKDMSDVNKES